MCVGILQQRQVYFWCIKKCILFQPRKEFSCLFTITSLNLYVFCIISHFYCPHNHLTSNIINIKSFDNDISWYIYFICETNPRSNTIFIYYLIIYLNVFLLLYFSERSTKNDNVRYGRQTFHRQHWTSLTNKILLKVKLALSVIFLLRRVRVMRSTLISLTTSF